MSWTNTHRKPTTVQKAVWLLTGVGVGVLAGKKPSWRKTLAAAKRVQEKVVHRPEPVKKPTEDEVTDLVYEVQETFSHGLHGQCSAKMTEALLELAFRMTGYENLRPGSKQG